MFSHPSNFRRPPRIPGLIQLIGGKEAFSNYLLKACQEAPLFETTGYGYEIHEMSEMATAPFGQLAISNQPSFHIPYLFRYSDYPDYTALLIKTLRQKAFHPSWEAYPGDEDNGSLSAWYIWSALGFYPTCPGKPSYDLGIPIFDHLRIYLAKEGKWLDIHAEQNHSHFNFVKECRLDKTIVSSIQHQDLLKAEQLTFTLSWLPNTYNQKNLCMVQRFFFMKLGLEVDPQADHPPLGSDRNLRFYLLQNTRLEASTFFQSRQLETQGHESRPDKRHHATPVPG